MAYEPTLDVAVEQLGLALAVRKDAFDAVREAAKTHEGIYMSSGVASRLIAIMDAAKVVLDIELATPAAPSQESINTQSEILTALPAPAATSISGGAVAKLLDEYPMPEYHAQGMGCGLEDQGIVDRYDAMQYGWDEAIQRVEDEVITPLRTALAAAPASVTSPVEPADAKSALVNDAERKYLGEVFDCLPDSMSDFLADFLRRLAPRAALTSSLGGAETPGWVPVGERLPGLLPGTDYSPRVLAFGDGGIDGPHFVAYYGKSYGWYLAHDNQPNMKVTHWQQLPSAPTPA